MELIGLLLLTFIFNKEIDCSNIPTESVENYTFLYEKVYQPVDELKTDYSNFVVEENPEGLGSAKNPIKLNNGLNVDVYCILINDTIVFDLNGFSIVDYKPYKFKITIGDVDTVFEFQKKTDETIGLSIDINGKKAIVTDDFELSDSLTVTINKNGNITVDNELNHSNKSLGTLPTINGDNVVHMKINGSEFSNATMNLIFQTKVGKLVDKKPLNGDPSTKPVANSSAGNFLSRLSDPKIIAGIVCAVAVVVASAIIVTCCLWPVCPIYQKFRNKSKKELEKGKQSKCLPGKSVKQDINTTDFENRFFHLYSINYNDRRIPFDQARINCFKTIHSMMKKKDELLNELENLKKKYQKCIFYTKKKTELKNQISKLKDEQILSLEKEMHSVLFKDWVRMPNYMLGFLNIRTTVLSYGRDLGKMKTTQNNNSEVKEKQVSSKK